MVQGGHQEIPQEVQKVADDLMRRGIFDELFMPPIILVESVMKRDVVMLDHTKTAYDAAALMIKKGIGCVIVTAYGQPFGIITERDIVGAVVGLKIPLENLILNILASRPLICTTPSQTIEEAAELMRRYNIRRLPVVKEGKIVGIVTIRDLVR